MIRSFAVWLLLGSRLLAGTVMGNLLGPSGLPVKNATLTFKLQQAGLAVGTGSVVPIAASCYTSADGSVVGLPNPGVAPTASILYGSGTLAAGTYYVAYAYYDSAGNHSLASPELRIQLTSAGSLTVAPPVSFPAAAAGMTIFVGTSSGGEMAQGNTMGSTQAFTQGSMPLSGAVLPAANASVCSVVFNDAIIPYSGYQVSLISAAGNAYPGWPQTWQLNGGLNGTVNISNGAPLWNGTVVYPTPLFAQPLNHGPQSISGPLNMSGYNLVGAGAVGVGTSTPSFPLDVENGYINTSLGYLIGGHAGTLGQCLVSNGTFFGPGSCGVSPTLYYQYVESNGALGTQEPYLNFAPRLTAVTNAGASRTDVDLATTSVTAGSYNNANLTIDAYPVSSNTSYVFPNPGATLYWRLRSSFDQKHWSHYTVQPGAVSSGLVSSAAAANNVSLNQSNYATVDSVANGSSATVRVYGSGGVGTSWSSILGGNSKVIPAGTIVNVAYGSNGFVAWDGAQYQFKPQLTQTFPDTWIPVGKVSVIANSSGLVLPVITAVVISGAIVAYQITNAGNGLTAPPVLTITDSTGSGATATAIVSAGSVTQVTPGNAGSGYSSHPLVSASGGVSGGATGGGGATGNNGGRLYADV